ncbi:MAG: WD40 repeat domain-containing protein [Oligoflexus sp.]
MPPCHLKYLVNILSLLFMLFGLSCNKLDNSYEQSVLDCGPLPTAGTYVKILAPDGKELADENIEVLSWQSDSNLQAQEVTAKACFLVEENQDYIIRHRSQNAALMTSSEQLFGLGQIKLQVLKETQQSVQCLSQFISRSTNLVHWLGAPDHDLSSYRLRVTMEHPQKKLSFTQEGLVSFENYSQLAWRLPRELEDGPYQLQFHLENLLRGTETKPVSCDVMVDNQLPQQELRIEESLQDDYMGFVKAEPGRPIQIETMDESPVKVHACWVEVEEEKLEQINVEDVSCELLATGPKLEVPGSGFWVLRYQTEDAAGNLSQIASQKIFAYDQLKIEQIKLLSETVPYDVDNLLNPTRGAYKALYAETLKRQLSTEYEKKIAEPFARQALFDIVHKPIPFREIESDYRPYGMLSHPQDDGFMVYTIRPGKVRRFDVNGVMVWESSEDLDDLPVKSSFSKDGKLYALAGSDGKIKVWDYETGEVVRSYERYSRTDKLAFNADATRLVSIGYDDQAYVYSLKGKEPLEVIGGFEGQLLALTWHPDGQSFVLGAGRSLYRYDLNGKPLAIPGQEEPGPIQLREGPSAVASAVFLPSGYLFVATLFNEANSGSVSYASEFTLLDPQWNVHTKDIYPANVEKVSLSPDGETIAFHGHFFKGILSFNNLSQVIAKEVSLSSQRLFMDTIDQPISGLYWGSKNNRLVATAVAGPIYTLTHLGLVMQKILDPSGKLYGSAQINQTHNLLITGNADGKIRFWQLESKVFSSYQGEGYLLQFKPNPKGDRWLVIESDLDTSNLMKVKILNKNFDTIRTWDLPTKQLVAGHYKQTKSIVNLFRSAHFIDDETLIFADLDGTVFIKNIDGSDQQAKLHFDFSENFPDAVLISFATFGQKILLGLSNGTVIASDLEQRSLKIIENAHTATDDLLQNDLTNTYVRFIKPFHENYPFLSVGIDGRVLKWDRDGESTVLFSGRRTPDISPTSDGRLLVAESESKYASLINDRGDVEKNFYGIKLSNNRVAFDSVSGFASTGSMRPHSDIFVWNDKEQLIASFKNSLFDDGINFLEWSEGRLIAGNINRSLEYPTDADLVYQRYCQLLDEYFRSTENIHPQVCQDVQRN